MKYKIVSTLMACTMSLSFAQTPTQPSKISINTLTPECMSVLQPALKKLNMSVYDLTNPAKLAPFKNAYQGTNTLKDIRSKCAASFGSMSCQECCAGTTSCAIAYCMIHCSCCS